MGARTSNISTLLAGMEEIANRDISPFNFVTSLRKYIVREDASLIDLSVDEEPEQIGLLYVLDTFLSDIWLNLATDASFEFPWDDPEMNELCENLRKTILVMADGKKDFDVGMKHLCEAIYHYHVCLNRFELELLNEGTKRREVIT